MNNAPKLMGNPFAFAGKRMLAAAARPLQNERGAIEIRCTPSSFCAAVAGISIAVFLLKYDPEHATRAAYAEGLSSAQACMDSISVPQDGRLRLLSPQKAEVWRGWQLISLDLVNDKACVERSSCNDEDSANVGCSSALSSVYRPLIKPIIACIKQSGL